MVRKVLYVILKLQTFVGMMLLVEGQSFGGDVGNTRSDWDSIVPQYFISFV